MAEALKAIDAGTALMEAEHKAGLAAVPFVPVNPTPAVPHAASEETAAAEVAAAPAASTATAAAAAGAEEGISIAQLPSGSSARLALDDSERAAEADAASGHGGPIGVGAVPGLDVCGMTPPATDACSSASTHPDVGSTGVHALLPSQQMTAAAFVSLAEVPAVQSCVSIPSQIDVREGSPAEPPILATCVCQAELSKQPEAATLEGGPVDVKVLDARTVAQEAACLQQHPVIASEEVAFAAMLGGSLQATMRRRDILVELSQKTQAQVGSCWFAI